MKRYKIVCMFVKPAFSLLQTRAYWFSLGLEFYVRVFLHIFVLIRACLFVLG